MKRNVSIAGLALLALAVSGCSDSSGPDDDDNGNTSVMSGSISGSAWTGSVVIAARSGTTVAISGEDTQDREILIEIDGVTAAGTFAIGATGPASFHLRIGSQLWMGHLEGSSGSVILSTLTSGGATGSFNVTLAPQTLTGASGTRVLTGTFTVYFGQT